MQKETLQVSPSTPTANNTLRQALSRGPSRHSGPIFEHVSDWLRSPIPRALSINTDSPGGHNRRRPLSPGLVTPTLRRARSVAGEGELTEFLTGRKLRDVSAEFFFYGRGDIDDTIRKTWRLLLTNTEIQLVVRWVANQINKQFVGQHIILTGILKGVFVFMTDLCRHLTIPYTCYFLEASSYRCEDTKSDKVAFLSDIVVEKFSGRKIVLLDVLFDRGQTLYCVSEALSKKLHISRDKIFTCTLFSKVDSAQNSFLSFPPPDLVGFDRFPDVHLVGYGLDDKGEKRGWPHIYAVPRPNDSGKTTPEELIFHDNNQAFAKLAMVRNVMRLKLTSTAASF